MIRIGITERGDAGIHLDEVLAKANQFDGVILITKSPQLILARSDELPFRSIVHCTITGYGGTKLEPGVAPVSETMGSYLDLVNAIGEDRVVLRVDPVMPTEKGLEVAKRVLDDYAGTRVRISFLDNYPHSRKRMLAAYPKLSGSMNDAYFGQLHAPAPVRNEMLADLEAYIGREIEVCGEPDMKCTGCVSQLDIDALRIEAFVTRTGSQRSACACLAPKTEMLNHRGQCKHACAYCYWR